MRTTKAEYEAFKSYCVDYQTTLGLKNWGLYFEHTKLKTAYAQTAWSTNAMAATIKFTTNWDNTRPKNDLEIKRVALHEVLHVLLAPLVSEAEFRYSTEDAIQMAEHSIVRQLESLVS